MATATNRRCRGRTEAEDIRSEHWLVAGHYDPEFREFIHSELERLAELPLNWDKYGAPKISRIVLAAAKEFANRLPENIVYRPRVVPMATGNFQFEWHDGPKILELEFENARTIRYLQWNPDKGIEEEDTFDVGNLEFAIDLIQWFMNET